MKGGLGARALSLTVPFCLYHTDYHQNNWPIIIAMLVLVPVVLAISVAVYIYNHQRKIRIYKLQKAQEEAMKLKAQAPPP